MACIARCSVTRGLAPDAKAEVEQLGALRHLQANGKIKHIGLSEVSVKQIQHARSIVKIVSVQNRLQHHRPRIGRCSGILRTGKAGIYSVVSAGGRSRFRLRESYRSYRSAMESYTIPGGSGMAARSISGHATDSGNLQGRTSRRKCRGGGVKG